jgi:mannosyltransferase
MKSSTETAPRAEFVLLAMATVLAAVLRLFKLGEWSYFIDELRTWDDALRESSNPLVTLLYPNQRQIFWLMTKLSLDAFGVNEISLRLLPCIIGILTIPLLYVPIKRFSDWRVALVAVFMLTVSPWHIYMSQMARWYTLSTLLMTYSLLAFFAFVNSNNLMYLVYYIILFGIAFTLHLTAGFVPLIAAIYLSFLLVFGFQGNQREARRIWIIWGFHIGFFLILLPKLVEFLTSWKALEESVGAWGSDVGLKTMYHMTPSIAVLGLIGSIILLRFKDRRGLFLAVYYLFPLAALNLGVLFQINVSTRYLLFILPAVLMGASYACMCLYEQLRMSKNLLTISVLLIAILPSLQTDYLYFTSEHGYRDRLKEAIQLIKQQKLDNDHFFLPGLYSAEDTRFYFTSEASLQNMHITDKQLVVSESQGDLDLKKRTWIITMGSPPANPNGYWKWIAEEAHLSAEFEARRGNQDQTIKVYFYSPEKTQ